MSLTRRRRGSSDEMLDRLLADAQAGRSEIEASSDWSLEMSKSLGPLVEAARRVRGEMAPTAPSPAFLDASEARLLNRLEAARPRKPRGLRPYRLSWRPAYALASVLLVGLLLGGVGVIRASAEAYPGGSLYSVKRAVEETRLALTWSTEGDAALMEQFAQERLSEASTLAAVGRAEGLAQALGGYNEMIDRLTNLAEHSGLEQGPASLARVQVDLQRNIAVLQDLSSRAPEAAQEHIRAAINRSSHNYAVIEELVTGGSPSDLAPGQQRTPKESGETPGADRGEQAGSTHGPKERTRTPGPPNGGGTKPTNDKGK
jgi:hypothetical protein